MRRSLQQLSCWFLRCLAGLFQSCGKRLDAAETLPGVFCRERSRRPALPRRRALVLPPQRWWGGHQVLGKDFREGAIKREFSTEPLIDDYTQCILVAGRTRMFLDLLRGHVGDGANGRLGRHRGGAVSNRRNAEVAEDDLIAPSNEQVLRLDIPMNEPLLMCIVQRLCHLLDIGGHRGERDLSPLW